jgi:hypothetical protein
MSVLDVAADGELTRLADVFVAEVRDVAVSSEITFLAASDALYATRPTAAGRAEVLGKVSLSQGTLRLQVVGTRAYVYTADNTIGANGHIRIVDVADPANMSVLGTINLANLNVVFTSKRFYVEGSTVYVAEPEGLVIYDVSDASQPRRVGSAPTPNIAENVFVRDGLAYVNTLRIEDGVTLIIDLYIFDVHNVSAPQSLGRRRDIDRANSCNDLFVQNGRLYLVVAGQGALLPSAGDGRLLVIGVRNPTKPRLKSKIPTNPSGNGYARDLFVKDDIAYVADGLDGVSLISVAIAGAPQFLRAINTPGFADGVWVEDDGKLSVADQTSYQVYTATPPATQQAPQ